MKDKKKILMVLGVVSIVLITIGIGYAFFSYSKNGSTENTISSDSITFLYDEVDQQGNGITLTNALPISDTEGKGQIQDFDFRIVSDTNTGISIPYEITLRKKVGSDDIDDIIKVYLAKTTDSSTTIANEEEVELSKYSDLETVTKNGHQEKLLHIDKVPGSNSTYNQGYRLKIWIDDSADYSEITVPAKCSDGSNKTEQECTSPNEWIAEHNEYPYNNKTFAVTVNVYANGHTITQQDIEAASRTDITSFSVDGITLSGSNNYYEANVAPGSTEATINVETENPYTTVVIEKTDSTYENVIAMNSGIQKMSTSKKVNISPGKNYFKITLRSEDGTKTSYRYLMIKSSNEVVKTGDSILSILADNTLTEGYYKFRVNNVDYSVDLIVIDGDQTITADTKYGDLEDCASGTETTDMAKKMVVVKVNGDYTVNSGVKVEPNFHSDYGGPKGFVLYVTGTLTNNGTINNNHGAYAEGQDVYLWKNGDDSYEYVPAVGGAGGVLTGATDKTNGTNGESGSNRSTGGGGSGATRSSKHVGSGSAGTSYSGGSGGAAAWSYDGGDALPNGGQGGTPTVTLTTSQGSGAGNPAGLFNNQASYYRADNGTGGLLVIYANNFINNNKIEAVGAKGGHVFTAGGSSGSGSVNVFYTGTASGYNTIDVSAKQQTYNNNTGAGYTGGAGGTGTVSVGSISTGTYVSTYKNY